MAEMIGNLREDATNGEKLVYKLLGQNLPKEYTVYVETPIRKKREIRYPDFTILTNYGVVVLEVKDWVYLEGRADPEGVTVRTRSGETRHERNPVFTAREMALALSSQLNTRLNQDQPGESVPWSCAAVLVNLPASVITQLQYVWGEEFVLGKDDLDIPDLLLSRIKKTFPVRRMRPLSAEELKHARAVIYPVVDIQMPGRADVILDEQQEKLVAEPIRQEPVVISKSAKKAEQSHRQEQLFETLKAEDESSMDQQPEGERISQNVAIRLVRGFSGSGKTLVLMQRARYLAAQYPAWNIGVLTFNKPLQEQLEQSFKGSSISPITFHKLCRNWLHTPDDRQTELDAWLSPRQLLYPIIEKIGVKAAVKEIDWIRDTGLTRREDYLAIERKGIGKDLRLTAEDRNGIYDVLDAYRNYMRENNLWDWSEIPLMALNVLEKKEVKPALYDAVLIDEAQDWAPIWFKVLQHVIRPETGIIFLADDPSQSIYRYFSWKEKGIHVVGRTRWLKVPYRNTYEIYRAAYSLIANYEEIQKSLSEEGELIEPELSSETMRHSSLPLVRKFRNAAEEMAYLKNAISSLRHDGYAEKEIAVLVRHNKELSFVQNVLRGSGVNAYTMHRFKGLEMEVVLIPGLQTTFARPEDEGSERRLLYMAMSRARAKLYLTYSGKLPQAYEELRKQGLADFVG